MPLIRGMSETEHSATVLIPSYEDGLSDTCSTWPGLARTILQSPRTRRPREVGERGVGGSAGPMTCPSCRFTSQYDRLLQPLPPADRRAPTNGVKLAGQEYPSESTLDFTRDKPIFAGKMASAAAPRREFGLVSSQHRPSDRRLGSRWQWGLTRRVVLRRVKPCAAASLQLAMCFSFTETDTEPQVSAAQLNPSAQATPDCRAPWPCK
jgi:hypothetical protein